jgi:hypothetical protein
MNNEQQKKTSMSGEAQDGLVDQAKHVMSTVAEKVGEQVSHGIEGQRDKAVQKVAGVAEAIRWGSGLLKNVGPLGEVSEKAADGVENVASFFENKQVGDIVRDVEGFARREPAIFFGAAFALGLIGGRFLKSSAHRSSVMQNASGDYGGYDRDYDDIQDDDYHDRSYGPSYASAGLRSEPAPTTSRMGRTPTRPTPTPPTPARVTQATGSTAGAIKPTPIINAAGSKSSIKPRDGAGS